MKSEFYFIPGIVCLYILLKMLFYGVRESFKWGKILSTQIVELYGSKLFDSTKWSGLLSLDDDSVTN